MGQHQQILCASLETVAEHVGTEAALALSRAFGGQELAVPGRAEGRIWETLIEAMGEPAARRFVHVFKGETLYVPLNLRGERAALKETVRALHADGLSPVEIARRIHLRRRVSARWVRKVIAEEKATARKRG